MPQLKHILPLLLMLATPLAASTAAEAATYTVAGCQRSDGTPISSEGWLASNVGAFTYFSAACPASDGLGASFDERYERAFGDSARWTFVAPASTTLASIAGRRVSSVGANRPFGTVRTFIRTPSTIVDMCQAGECSTLDGNVDLDLGGASSVAFGVECAGGPEGSCPAGPNATRLNRIKVRLNDATSPRIVGAPSGTLLSETVRDRTRALSYAADDTGSGVFLQKLFVDGAERQSSVVDGNGGKCVQHPAHPDEFLSPVPCSTSVSGGFSFDTSSLSDGQHQLELRVFDATKVNRTSFGPWNITVDNVAPTVGPVSITGVAREGETLACSADVSGQSPTTSYAWYRASSDGSGETAITGATSPNYVLAAADVGKKVLCEVAGRDAGGTATRKSTLTSGPFADGRTVEAKPVVSNPPTSGGTGATGPAGPAGSNGTSGGTSTAGTNSTMSSTSDTTSSSSTDRPVTVTPAVVAAQTVVSVAACPTTRLLAGDAPQIQRRTYARSATSMTGRLVDGQGQPVAQKSVDVMQVVARVGGAQRKKIGTLQTDANGAFKVAVPRGPSRQVQLDVPGCGTVGALVSQQIRGAIRARTTTRKIRNKQTARFSGQVLGGYVGRGLPLELQVRVGNQWRPVKGVTTDAQGRFRASYRFVRTFVRYTYTFRVITRTGGAWPYLPARSKVIKVRVN